jgi:translocation and assembly module TamB
MLPAGSSGARGKLSLRVADLQDLQRVVGAPLQGRVAGTVKFSRESGRGRAEIRLEAMAAGTPDRQVGHLLVSGRIDDAPSDPMFNLQAVAEDIVTPQVSGSARLDARGPARGVVLKLESRWHAGTLDTAHVSSTATLDVPRRRLAVSGLKATYRGQTARLLAPTTVSLQDGLSLGVVRIGIQKATLTISGAVTPTLDAAVSLTNAPLALLAIFRPAWQADGLITADARLTGMVSAPTGILHVSGSGLRVRSGAGRGMPLTDVVGTAALHGDIAAVDLRLHAGAAGELRIVGSLPLRPDQAFDVRASGQVALAIANPYVEPDGRRVSGRVTINAVLTGTRAAPLLGGTLVLDHGDFQDFVRGTHFSEVSLALQAAQRTVRITRMLAHAGPGTVSAEGTIGLLVPGIPLDLRLTAINARVLASDLLTARVDATLTVRGEANGRMEAVGSLRVNRADITVPKAFPRTVAVLDVRRPGARRGAPKPRVAIPIGLDLVVDAPRAVFVRGRGIEAELGGELHVSGTTDAPRFAGGFDLRRGTLALAGASLKFTSGRVGFNGAGVGTALDPTLHFVADTTSTDMTATLTVGGYASAPTVLLTSTPELAQDEILARLLFGESAKQLTPLQLLRVGLALASIGGSGYGAADPLSAIQKRLGLDHLAVGGNSGPNGNEATLEAGGYTSERVYVGAVQSTSGTTKLLVQVDLTKHLKLQAVVGNGGAAVPGTTPQNDPGNTIGLSYQIDY